MPAKSAKQLKKAYAEADKGKEWGKKMVEDTPDAVKSRLLKHAHNDHKRMVKQRNKLDRDPVP